MEDYILQKTEKWPKDWDKHFFNTCKLYFEDKIIDFEDGFSTDVTFLQRFFKNWKSINLEAKFKINNFNYLIYMEEENKLFGFVVYYYKIKFHLEFIKKQEKQKNCFNIIQQIENIILKDYNDRNKGGGRGGNKEKNPIKPVNSNNLKPLLV